VPVIEAVTIRRSDYWRVNDFGAQGEPCRRAAAYGSNRFIEAVKIEEGCGKITGTSEAIWKSHPDGAELEPATGGWITVFPV